MIFQWLLAIAIFTASPLLLAAPVKQVKIKNEPPPEKTKWYQDLSVGAGVEFRRQYELNKETEFNNRVLLHADRLWNDRWIGGAQYSYDRQSTSSGSIGVERQNHEILLRGQARIHQFINSNLWLGLSVGFDKDYMKMTIADNKTTRWSNWQWIVSPEISHRHPLYQNIWMQEAVAYTEREYSAEGDWSLALRIGVDLSSY